MSEEAGRQQAMEQVRGIRLAARGLAGAMHHAYATPEGSVERAAAMLALDERIADFLSLPGNSPAVAMLAVGRIAFEVTRSLGEKLGLDPERLAAQVDQYLLAAQFGEERSGSGA
ncbi:hypothetical protein D3248_04640 [Leucobacter zeae]|nr:hypothetical protein [Leucobacter zeae]